MSPRFRRSLGALELLALAGAVYALVGPRQKLQQPAQSASQLTSAILTGYVLDAATGKPVKDAQVSTIPATETVVTNGQGLYVISAGQAFGTATVVADAGRYRQVRATCVTVKAGLNTSGDVVLLHQDEDVDGVCPTACADGEDCRLGHCVPSCAPACDCTEKCEAGACVANLDVPGADSCGVNASWLGGGLCACKPGYVPSAQGRTCVSATQATNCPINAFATESGCVCSQGFVPDRAGELCVTPEEAAVPAPLGDASIVGTWQLPMKTPRSLAVAGTKIWTLNLDTEDLTELTLGDDGMAVVASVVALGPDAWRITDIAATETQVFMARRGLGEQTITGSGVVHPSSLMVVDVATGQIKHLLGNNIGDVSGIAVADDQLITLEGMYRRRSLIDASEVGLPLMHPPPTIAADQLLVPGYEGLSFSRNQLVTYLGTTYDGATFVGRFEATNGVGASVAGGLPTLAIPIQGSHVAGFELSGTIGWLVVGGSGLEQPIIEKVSFDAGL